MDNLWWRNSDIAHCINIVGSVPVVVGAPNIQDFSPFPGSILHIRELKDVDSIVRKIKYLAKNSSAYNESLRWALNSTHEMINFYVVSYVDFRLVILYSFILVTFSSFLLIFTNHDVSIYKYFPRNIFKKLFTFKGTGSQMGSYYLGGSLKDRLIHSRLLLIWQQFTHHAVCVFTWQQGS